MKPRANINTHEAGEAAVAQQRQIDDRIVARQFPNDQSHQRDGRDRSENVTMKFEPNQSSRWPLSSTTCSVPKPEGHQPEADVIDLQPAGQQLAAVLGVSAGGSTSTR